MTVEGRGAAKVSGQSGNPMLLFVQIQAMGTRLGSRNAIISLLCVRMIVHLDASYKTPRI
jgi:hypothetical protein